jgi:spore maturation protein CgeB
MEVRRIRILFIGESWLGSCARSMREALARRLDLTLDEVGEDLWFSKPRARWLRGINRLTTPARLNEFNREVLMRVREFRPDLVITYKGSMVRTELLRQIRALNVPTVNIYPDYSPHMYGEAHRDAVGEYDLVISTKPFHPKLWERLYGYSNRCVFVPQGYDPLLHLFEGSPEEPKFDLVMIATWREEYGRLVSELARELEGLSLRVAIGGNGWEAASANLPKHWIFPGGLHGRVYIEWLRRGRICIAPLTRNDRAGIDTHPGDEDTTRTYELAAASCFFLHRRTEYVRTLYDEMTEVPLFDDAAELASLIRRYLPNESARRQMANAAHYRAVPSYSTDNRASAIVEILQDSFPRALLR